MRSNQASDLPVNTDAAGGLQTSPNQGAEFFFAGRVEGPGNRWNADLTVALPCCVRNIEGIDGLGDFRIKGFKD
jgi:hypothetical protein